VTVSDPTAPKPLTAAGLESRLTGFIAAHPEFGKLGRAMLTAVLPVIVGWLSEHFDVTPKSP
jgi:hypothetical protein